MGSGPRYPRHRLAPYVDWIIGSVGDDVLLPCGSYRRLCPEMGDIDLVCLSEASAVPDRLQALGIRLVEPGVPRWVFALDVDWCPRPIKVDLWVPLPGMLGACIAHATGSGMHNVLMRRYGFSRGLSFTWAGVSRLSDGVVVAGGTESSVFEALGWPMLPPEGRESVVEWALPLMESIETERV